MNEPTLFSVEPVVEVTVRQQFVLDALGALPNEGLRADEVGAMLCARRGRHSAGTRCEYDSSNGTGVLKALKKKGLVRRRRDGSWLALASAESREHGSADASAQGPGDFPEGY